MAIPSRLIQKIEATMHSPTKQRRRLSNNGPMETKEELNDKNLPDSPRRRTKTPSRRRRSSDVGRSPRKASIDMSLCATSRQLSKEKDQALDSPQRRTKTPMRRQRSGNKLETETSNESPRHPMRAQRQRSTSKLACNDNKSETSKSSISNSLRSPSKAFRKSLVGTELGNADQQKQKTSRAVVMGRSYSMSVLDVSTFDSPALDLPALDLPVVPRGVPILPAAASKFEPLEEVEPKGASRARRSVKLSANRRDSPRRRMRRQTDDTPPTDLNGEPPKTTDAEECASPRRQSFVRAFSCEVLPLGSPSKVRDALDSSNHEEYLSSTMRRRHETKPVPEWKRRLQHTDDPDMNGKERSEKLETPARTRRTASRRASTGHTLAQASLLTDKLAGPSKTSRPTFSRQPSSMRRCRTPDGRRSKTPDGRVTDFWMFG